MFTGIVEELGQVVAVEPTSAGALLRVRAQQVAAGQLPGASVAVDGACLTITDVDADVCTFDVVPETLTRTTLGRRQAGDVVNLERAVRADGRLDGHIVAGHVDTVVPVLARSTADGAHVLRIGLPGPLAGLVAPKGSIAVDGVSLTVVDVTTGVDDEVTAPTGSFTVALIPTTLARTSLGRRDVGELVNLEVDVLARYVAAAVGARTSGLST